MKFNQYASVADLYDFGNGRARVAPDVAFYKSLVAPGACVLEVGCGTGRVAVELARHGCKVTGVDLSAPMLKVFRRKLRADPGLGIKLSLQDMTKLKLGRTFGTILLPFRVFQALTSDRQRMACLKSLRRHLCPGGRIVLTLFNPSQAAFAAWGGQGLVDFDVEVASPPMRIRRLQNQKAHDAKRQTITAEFVYEVTRKGKKKPSLFKDWIRLGYLYPSQCLALFRKTGLSVKDAFGFYDKRPLTGKEKDKDKRELIYVLEAADDT